MTSLTPPADRYGRAPGSGRRSIIIFAAGALLAFSGWVAWVFATDTTTGVEITPVSMTSDGQNGTVTFHLTAPVGTPVRCIIRSIGTDHTVNGWIVRDYAGSSESTTQYTESIRGFAPIASIDIQRCWKTPSS